MEVDKSHSSQFQHPLDSETGFAILLGPDFHLVLTSLSTTLGRHRRQKKRQPEAGKGQKLLSPYVFKYAGITPNNQPGFGNFKDYTDSPMYWQQLFYQKIKTDMTNPSTTKTGEEIGEVKSQIQENADIDLGPDPFISHHHATISYDSELSQWEITCTSRNGLWVNGRNISRGENAHLFSNSRVRISSICFLFLIAQPQPLHKNNSSPPSSSNGITLASIEESNFKQSLVIEKNSLQKPLNDKTDSIPDVEKSKQWKRGYHAMKPIFGDRPSGLPGKRRKLAAFSEHISEQNHLIRSIYHLDNQTNLTALQSQVDVASLPAHLSADFAPEQSISLNSYGLSGTSNGKMQFDYQNEDSMDAFGAESSHRSKQVTAEFSGKSSTKPSVDTSKISAENLARPNISFAKMIVQALESKPQKKMLFPEIADYILENWPYYITVDKATWTNSVRHALSSSSLFTRKAREEGKGKGGFWCLSSWYGSDGTLLAHPKSG